MGQVSLPRLNKLTCSMFWESGVFFNTEHWASLKLYLFFKYFSKFFFLYPVMTYIQGWQTTGRVIEVLTPYLTPSTTPINQIWKPQNLLTLNSAQKISPHFLPLKMYLYQINEIQYIFFIYLAWKKILNTYIPNYKRINYRLNQFQTQKTFLKL